MPLKSVWCDQSAGDDHNLMVEHYNNPRWNTYHDDDPGQVLFSQLQNDRNDVYREDFGIHISNVSELLTAQGVLNLCERFGHVKKVDKRRNFAFVYFWTAADALDTIKNINLQQSNLRMRAEFKKPKSRRNDDKREERSKPDDDSPMPKFEAVAIKNEFALPLGTPTSLDSLEPQPLLERDNQFGFETKMYEHTDFCQKSVFGVELQNSNESTFDDEEKEFVHTVSLEFTEKGECKNCGNATIKFCKGCKDSFCSLHCLKQYNSEKAGCLCTTSKKMDINKPIRNAAGRGIKLLSPRVVTPTPFTSPRWTADTDSIGEEQNGKAAQTIHTIEPHDLKLNNKLVAIVRAVSHTTVFLRPVEPEHNQKYFKYLNDVVEYGKTAPPLDRMPKKGDIVLADHKGCCYRAMVEQIQNDEAVVDFLELGYLARVPLKSFKKMRDDLQYEKRFIFKVTLSGVDGGIKNDKCLTYLQALLDKGIHLKIVKVSDDVQCELVISSTNESVNAKLASLNAIKPGNLVEEKDLPIKLLHDVREVIVIDNSLASIGFVTVTIPEYSSHMFYLHERIQEYCKDNYKPPYSPRQKEICLAKATNDQWYRAKMVKSYGDRNPIMEFIDFILYNKVNVNNMRPMPQELALPRYSVSAEIGGLTDRTDRAQLRDAFPLLAKLPVVKMENPYEPKMYFDLLLPEKADNGDSNGGIRFSASQQVNKNFNVDSKTSVFKPRRLLLEILLDKLTA